VNDNAHSLLDLRVAAAARVAKTARELMREAARTASEPYQTLLLVIGERAARTYDASVALASHGDGIQAAMLNRSLLEDALDVVWVDANPQDAMARADEHDRAISLADRDIEWKAKGTGSRLTPAEQDELRAAIRRYKGFQASWTLSSEPDRIVLLKARMPTDAADSIDYAYDAIKRRSNALLHGSPAAWHQLIDRGPNGLRIREGVPDHWWLEALRHAVLGHHLVMRSIAASFRLDPTAQNDAFHHASCVTSELTVEQLAVVDRASPCPCGSGRSFESCRGLAS
jgi:hypothetical protein